LIIGISRIVNDTEQTLALVENFSILSVWISNFRI